ncbi:hypothetical protein ACPOL_5174 [Acidisarcina polymorpha]|uniref:Uncharacterized protein n=1 Tax=Acidisarcina polymorpha TaxID=2211140 RepID=A0A2Z5G5Q1_9BACT|nr:hypothetical protein ACPOL_5174 [Acidisarcina polymorpha]
MVRPGVYLGAGNCQYAVAGSLLLQSWKAPINLKKDRFTTK